MPENNNGIDELFQEILETRERGLVGNEAPWPRKNPIASDLSPCARETALSILHWKERPPPGAKLLARFQVGREQELVAMRQLSALGFQVVESQRPFDVRRRGGGVLLSGKIDGRLLWRGERIPFDYKTLDPRIFDRLNTMQDLLEHPFFQKWVKQLWSYLYLAEHERGFLLVDNLVGEWKFIAVDLDYAAMEEILVQCESAMSAVEAVYKGAAEQTSLPAYHPNPEVCHRCWAFQRFCHPPSVTFGPGLEVLDSPEIEALIDRRNELHPLSREFDKLDTRLKTLFRDKTGVLVGDWLVEGKGGSMTLAAREKSTIPTWRIQYRHLSEKEAQKEDGG